MTSLKQNISVLLYEKEKILNSILKYQISNHNNIEVFTSEKYEELNKIIINRSFDAYILNLNNLGANSENFLKLLRSNNKHAYIIAYQEPFLNEVSYNLGKVFLLDKPFKLFSLLNYLDSINNTEVIHNSNKYLTDYIIFSPSKKTIFNLETHCTEHLTEKENNLLIYFFNKKNIELLKKDLLTNIWGVSNEINTHTLETHIYRLKQKLLKLDTNLSFSLVNKNGLYCMKYID